MLPSGFFGECFGKCVGIALKGGGFVPVGFGVAMRRIGEIAVDRSDRRGDDQAFDLFGLCDGVKDVLGALDGDVDDLFLGVFGLELNR